jgi:dihydroxyacetone kinase
VGAGRPSRRWQAAEPEDVLGFGRAIAMKVISTVGGASGPLYGSFFLALGTAGGSTASSWMPPAPSPR